MATLAIVGAGALGSLLAFFFCEVHPSVVVVTRTVQQAQLLRKKGVVVTLPEGKVKTIYPEGVSWEQLGAHPPPQV